MNEKKQFLSKLKNPYKAAFEEKTAHFLDKAKKEGFFLSDMQLSKPIACDPHPFSFSLFLKSLESIDTTKWELRRARYAGIHKISYEVFRSCGGLNVMGLKPDDDDPRMVIEVECHVDTPSAMFIKKDSTAPLVATWVKEYDSSL